MNKIKKNFAFTSIAFLLFISMSCRSAKYLAGDQALVTRNEIEGIPTELKESAQSYISNEVRPNSRVNLFVYNLFNGHKGEYRYDRIRNVGEPPNILDTSLVEMSGRQIQGFLENKGYFNAQVQPDIEVKNKKANIIYDVELGKGFKFGNVSYKIVDKELEAIYVNEVKPLSRLSKESQYDIADLLYERELSYEKFKNKGYFDYVRQYMRVGIDTLSKEGWADLSIEIDAPEGKSSHQKYKLDSVYLTIHKQEQAPQIGRGRLDSNLNIIYTDLTGKFKLKPISRYMFLKQGDTYNLQAENLSYDRLYEMNGFKSVKINYEKTDSATLNVYYDLVPRAVMGNQVEGEFAFSSGMSGFNIGNTFSHRNIFGGAEQLEVKLRYGVLFDPRLSGGIQEKIFNNDMQVGVNLIIPRILVPFRVRSVGRYGLARTTFSTNVQIFNQLNTYSNRYFINTLNYSWYEANNKQHSFSPIVLEYRVGRLDKAFEEELKDDGYLLYVRSNNREYFGLGTQYSFTLNNTKLLSRQTFNFFRGSVDISGNLLSMLGGVFNFSKNQHGESMVFGVPFLQYAKGEIDYRRYIHLGGNKQLVLRANTGMALPYGNNSSLLIFEKSFFAGGMNGIRAWQARTLGPGNYNREAVPENLRLNLRNLDQLGELKIESNAEYRFRIMNAFFGAKLNGATFVDVGNIWRIRENEMNPGGEFEFSKLWDQLAIGTGFGFRIDMNYFVIRLDAGLKLKDPQFASEDQWVVKDLFRSKEFKRNYYESHRPDRYNFIQYNFGVGLPF